MRLAKAVRVVIINFLIFLSLLVIIEGSVRLLYPEITPQNLDRRLFDPYKYGRTYGYRPLSTGKEFGALYLTDEHGFRTSKRSFESDSSGLVVVLGDSVSVGVGVEIDQTYPFLLQEKLGRKILNASVTGYGILDYVEVVKAIAHKFKPELLIMGICLNDVATGSQANIIAMVQNTSAGGLAVPDERRYPNRVVRTLRYINDNYFNFNNFLKSHSMTYLYIKSLVSDTARDYFSADKVFYQDPKVIEFLSSQFAELKRLLPETLLLLAIFPYEYQLRANSFETLEPQKSITEAGRMAGVAMYDLYDDLAEHLKKNFLSSKSIYLFNDPMHFNSLGHHVIAELVYRHIKKEIIN